MDVIAYVGGLTGVNMLCYPGLLLTLQVESDEYCRDVLAFRMADGFLSSGAIYSDITTYQPTAEEARAHGIVGGFPCQDPLL